MEYLVKLMKRQPISDKIHNFSPQLVVRQSVRKIGPAG